MIESHNNVFQSPVKINAGRKALAHIPFELSAMGAERPFLITTKALGKKRAVQKVVNGMKDSSVPLGIYDEVGAPARQKTVLDLAALFHEGGFDAIMALGSGSVMHTAKALNLMVSGNSTDLSALAVAGDRSIGRLKPYIAISATPGDGYETTAHARVERLTFSSFHLMPKLVLVDPEVFEPEPPIALISGAMAALTHAVEGFVGTQKNRFMDAYARTAIQMTMQYIIPALTGERGWKTARSAIAMAETMAGCVYSNMEPGLTHRLSLAIAKKTAWPQGICMGILLPYVLDHLSTRDDYFVGSLLLPMAGPETCSITAEEFRIGKALTMIQELQFTLYEHSKNELPMTLEDVGIKSEQLKPMVASLSHEVTNGINEETLLMILERALKGDPIDVEYNSSPNYIKKD